MSSILTNNSSMVALETLRNINKNLATVQNEISTGKKVSNAKDNAAIWAISTVMSTDVESFKQITDSLNLGTSIVGVARGAAETVTSLLQDMKELIVSAQEDLNAGDRGRIQTDIDKLRTQIGNIVNAAQFNGQNLLTGDDSISILASLDRSSTGAVTATKITVDRQNLTTTAAVDPASKAADAAGYVSTTDTVTEADVDKVAGDGGFLSTTQTGDIAAGSSAAVTIASGSVAVGDVFTINVGGSDYSYTAVADDTINSVAAGLKAAIDGGTISDLTVTVTDAADPSADNAVITLSVATGATAPVGFDPANLGATFVQGTLEDGNSVAVSIAGGVLTAGETFTVNADGNDYTYTAVAGDTANSVAAGLKALLDAANISNLEVTVTEAADATGAATLTLAADGGDVQMNLSTLGSASAATPAGGLGALAELDVTTAAGAAEALGTIETLMNTAISAAAAFGSAQKQIEYQGEFVQTLIDSMTSGIGAMVDADMEAASAKLQALQVQQQLGVQALSIANQAPQVLLSLFR